MIVAVVVSQNSFADLVKKRSAAHKKHLWGNVSRDGTTS